MPLSLSVGILGGTGPAGRGLGARLGRAGADVVLGSRAKDRADEAAATVLGGTNGTGLSVRGGTNEEAAGCEIVVVATPWDATIAMVKPLCEMLEGKLVISMVNAITRIGNEFQALVPVRGSMAATIAAALPKSRVGAAFHHLPASALAALDTDLDADVLVCADAVATGKETVELVDAIDGLRGVLAGTLASANAVEALTAVLLNVNVRYKAHVALRLAGLDQTH